MTENVYRNNSRGIQQRVKYINIFLAVFLVLVLVNILYRIIFLGRLFLPGYYFAFPVIIILLLLNRKGYYKAVAMLTPMSVLAGIFIAITAKTLTEISFAYGTTVLIFTLFFSSIRNTMIIAFLSIIVLPLYYIFSYSPENVNFMLLFEVLSANILIFIIALLFARTVQVDMDDKTTLIGEIQHRVNNTLETFRGLVEMHDFHNDNPEIKDTFKHLNTLVLCMGSVHKNIDSKLNYHTVNFSNTAAALIEICSLNNPGFSMSFTMEKQKQIYLRIEKSLPLAIILAELMQELSQCHADGMSLEIKKNQEAVEIFINGEDTQNMISEKSITNEDSLSGELVQMLLMQIDADIKVKDTAGNLFHISFEDLKQNMKFR